MKNFVIGVLLAFSCIFPTTADEITLGNWNIQTLVHSGDALTVFPDDHVRSAADFADLRRWRDVVDADVYFLQEVTSPKAIDEIFPVIEGWNHCISGQYGKLEGLSSSGPICSDAEHAPLIPTATQRQQFTGLAVRRSSGVTIKSVSDYASLDVKSDDNGTIREVRWGLDVTLSHAGAEARPGRRSIARRGLSGIDGLFPQLLWNR